MAVFPTVEAARVPTMVVNFDPTAASFKSALADLPAGTLVVSLGTLDLATCVFTAHAAGPRLYIMGVNGYCIDTQPSLNIEQMAQVP